MSSTVIAFIVCMSIALIMIFLGKFLQKKDSKKALDHLSEPVNEDDVEEQREKAVNLSLNKEQNDLIFTKDYIIFSDSHPYAGRVIPSKKLKGAQHFIYTVNNRAIGIVRRDKFIQLIFEDGITINIEDKFNQNIVNKKKNATQYNFDNSILLKLKKLYPWIYIGSSDNNSETKEETENHI